MEGDLEGDLERDLEGELELDSKGDFRGDFKQDIEGDLMSSSGQVRSRLGLVQVWFSLQLKFNSLELDSKVGRLVAFLLNLTYQLEDRYFPRSSQILGWRRGIPRNTLDFLGH